MGALAPFSLEFQSRLAKSGYTELTSVLQMKLLAHMGRWMEVNGLGVDDLTSQHLEEYLAVRRAAGWAYTLGGLAPILGMLTDLGVLPNDYHPRQLTPAEALLESFKFYLVEERGLSSSTVGAYVLRAGAFLANYAADADLSNLTAKDVSDAVFQEAMRVSVGATQYFVAALRAFLRFCVVNGHMQSDLTGAALRVTGRRRTALPKGLDNNSGAALLRGCDRRRSDGQRDYAILITLLRLGLRAGELAALTLEDIDWRAAEIRVHGKGRSEDRLPLPADVGEAIVDYLKRGRPATTKREVFLRTVAPIGPLGRSGVSCIVRRACVRADIPEVGAHRLRHTAACQMLAAGSPLAEIGQVLRHRSVISTAIYARVNIDQLRQLAQPWPGGESR